MVRLSVFNRGSVTEFTNSKVQRRSKNEKDIDYLPSIGLCSVAQYTICDRCTGPSNLQLHSHG